MAWRPGGERPPPLPPGPAGRALAGAAAGTRSGAPRGPGAPAAAQPPLAGPDAPLPSRSVPGPPACAGTGPEAPRHPPRSPSGPRASGLLVQHALSPGGGSQSFSGDSCWRSTEMSLLPGRHLYQAGSGHSPRGGGPRRPWGALARVIQTAGLTALLGSPTAGARSCALALCLHASFLHWVNESRWPRPDTQWAPGTCC